MNSGILTCLEYLFQFHGSMLIAVYNVVHSTVGVRKET